VALVPFSAMAKYFKDFFPTYYILSIRAEPARQKMAQSPPQWHNTPVDIKENGLHSTTNRQWLKQDGAVIIK